MRAVIFVIAILIAGYFFYPRTQATKQNTEFTQRIERKIAQVKEQNRVEIQKQKVAKSIQKSDSGTAKLSPEQLDEIKMQEVVESFNKHTTGIMNAWATRRHTYRRKF